MLQVNTLGSIYPTKALLPAMLEAGRGWIVFMASVAGRIATPDESLYAATKFALVGLAESLSLELEDAGIHVLTVCPGAVRTPFFGVLTNGVSVPDTPRATAHASGTPSPTPRAKASMILRGRWRRGTPRRMPASAANATNGSVAAESVKA